MIQYLPTLITVLSITLGVVGATRDLTARRGRHIPFPTRD